MNTLIYFISLYPNREAFMRFFYVYRSIAHFRGMERIFVDKINYLVQMYGYDVWLVTADQGDHPFSYPLDEKAHHVDLNIRFHTALRYPIVRRVVEKIRLQYLFVKRLKKLIASQQPDILVCNTDVFPNLVMLAKGNLPFVVESHNIYRKSLKNTDSLRWRILRWYTLRNLRRARLIVALTEGDARDWRKINNDVRVIHNVVHLNEEKRYSDVSSKRVIFSSRFAAQKGIPYLIEIWRRLHACYPDWGLDVYADGEQLNVYKPKMEEMNMNVVFHAPSCDIFKHYCDSSIFMLTSVFEPFGLVIPEAMSCGLPVIAFDCDFGPREMIEDGKNGFLIPSFDVDAYVSRMSQLMDSKDLRMRMGQTGIASSKRFSPEMIMPHWKNLFEELAS